MWAMVVKEFRELRRDRRTMAMMVFMPLVLLVVFGYAASFDVKTIPTIVVGPGSQAVAASLPGLFDVVEVQPEGDYQDGYDALQRGRTVVAMVATQPPQILIDGTEVFSARAALVAFSKASQLSGIQLPTPQVLFNPGLESPVVMIPAIAGLILAFAGTIFTSLGVVRERQTGTLDQLAVMPFRPRDVFMGKLLPYFGIVALDAVVIVGLGVAIFHVPFRGSVLTLALGGVLFLFVTLGMGVLISSVSENQGQAIQLAFMMLLPQVLLSGMLFPVQSMAAGVRWISYLLPLTYFIKVSRGVMVRGAPIDALILPLAMLALLGTVVFGLAIVRFRGYLAPSSSRKRLRRKQKAGVA
jgi:ABC-2 type transport system permease protein